MIGKELTFKGIDILTRLLIEEDLMGINNTEEIITTMKIFEELGVTLIPEKHGCHWNSIYVSSNEFTMEEAPICVSKKEIISILFQRNLSKKEIQEIKKQWRAFYDDPIKHKNLVSVIEESIGNLQDIGETPLSEVVEGGNKNVKENF